MSSAENDRLPPNLVSHLADADMQAAPRALLRAAHRAREIARQTGTPLIICRDGAVVEVWPEELDELDARSLIDFSTSPILTAVNPKRLLAKIAAGHLRNVRFSDLEALVAAFGFRLARTEGSHCIYQHASIAEQLNLQDVAGEAKPYQIRQFLRLVERYDLRMKGDM